MRRLIGAVLAAAGAAGVTACLVSAFTGMRDVMVTDGGTCASGGPYVVAHQCSSADVKLLMVGILGGLVCAGFFTAGTGLLGVRVRTAALLMWAALFGTLGWNFISLGLHPPAGMSGGGWLFTGVMFWLMAAGGLIPVMWAAVGWLRRGGQPQPSPSPLNPQTVQAMMQFPPTPIAGGQFTVGGSQFPLGGTFGAPGNSGAPGISGTMPPNPARGPSYLNLPQPEDSP